MKPMAAAVAGSLISGMAMYAVGARAAQNDAFVETPAQALVQPLEQQQPRAILVSNNLAPRPVTRTQARRPVYRTEEPAPVYRAADRSDDIVYRNQEDVRPEERSKTKTALIIGGSAASGAGVGAIVGGKKGALIGAALGGGAASIYEATKRK